MALFSSPRVVVIDDEQKEAMPIIQAFSALRIPAAWYTGVAADVPAPPLPNVRVLILDLFLGTAIFEPKTTAGVVLRALAPTLKSGPCLFLVWTAHPDEKEEFDQALRAYNEGLKVDEQVLPLATICLRKSEFIQNGRANGEALLARIEKELATLAPFDLVLQWEASCAEAAATTVGDLSSLAFRLAQNMDNWGEALAVILDALVKVSAGKAAPEDRTSADYLEALFEPLALIHEDRTRQLTNVNADQTQPGASVGSLTEKVALARLNHILLASPAKASDLPGAVLPLRGAQIPGAPFVASAGEVAFEQFLARVFGDKYDRNKEAILRDSIPVIVELTPACDHAQAKRERLRFAAGLLLPQGLEKKTQKAAYLNRVGPLVHENQAVTLVLDSLHFFSLPKDVALPASLFRLRSHVRADLQTWLGGHLARPGHLSM